MLGLLKQLEKDRDKPVLVEGLKDKACLESLGFSKVSILNKPLYKVVEEFGGEEVVLLTDLDKTGQALFERLRHEFQQRGVRVNSELRRLIGRTKLRQIEGLRSYLERNPKFYKNQALLQRHD